MTPAPAPLVIAGRELRSRLILGTGGFANHEVLADALAASGAELVTVALRRLAGGRDRITRARSSTCSGRLGSTCSRTRPGATRPGMR